MAQGEFTKQEAAHAEEALKDLIASGIPKARRAMFLGHATDLFSFIGAAKRAAPDEEEAKAKEGGK